MLELFLILQFLSNMLSLYDNKKSMKKAKCIYANK